MAGAPTVAGTEAVEWVAPGPGRWTTDFSRFPAPVSTFQISQLVPALVTGLGQAAERMGFAVDPRRAVVNRWLYGTALPVDASVVARREPAARAAVERRLWRQTVERWHSEARPAVLARCAELQAVEPKRLDDGALAEHAAAVTAHTHACMVEHFSNIGAVVAVGRFLLAAQELGVSHADALSLLGGASPASADAMRALDAVVHALSGAAVDPEAIVDLDDVRRASPDAAAALDAYLAVYGWRTVTSFDVDGLTLVELPEAVVSSIRSRARRGPADEEQADTARAAATSALRDRLTTADRAAFDDLLGDARAVYGVRDDDVGPVMWMRGLTRRLLLEVGRRAFAAERLADPTHAFELRADEVAPLAVGDPVAPAGDVVAARARERAWAATLDPPPFLDGPAPDPVVVPQAVEDVTAAYRAYIGNFARKGEGLRGEGIGAAPYRGTARVVTTVEEALATFEPGDILVTVMTTPAFNTILGMAGAIVTQEGGMTSHPAILARELGIPAVIGAPAALREIPQGATVEVDPAAGEVRVVAP